MKKCELCKSLAKLFCESDQASLCWECDSKVHGANFLVTKHPRILLCHVCQSLTAWHGTGPKFVPTISVCDNCVTNHSDTYHQQDRDHHEDRDHHDETEEYETETGDDDAIEDEDDEENQVVPWTSSSTSPPQLSSSSNCSTSSTSFSN